MISNKILFALLTFSVLEMGLSLAQSSRKNRIGTDPRNTYWSNDQNRFGHQQLMAMGWKPGQGLGASIQGIREHIKIKPKIEGRGLGQPSSPDIPTGLDDFQRLLGKLNGNVAEVEKKIEDVKRLGLYANFVRGEVIGESSENEVSSSRKAQTKCKLTPESTVEYEGELTRKEFRKKEKLEKLKRKAERAAKKQARAEKKELKNRKKGERMNVLTTETSGAPEGCHSRGKSPTSSKPGAVRGIRATRSRYIAMKRQATSDEKGLKEILMI